MTALVVLITWLSCTSLGINVNGLVKKDIRGFLCQISVEVLIVNTGHILSKISCTFAFEVAELETVNGGDGSLMSSASSTCAFFELDWVLAKPAVLSFTFLLLLFEPLLLCWQAAGPHSVTVLLARLLASLSKPISPFSDLTCC